MRVGPSGGSWSGVDVLQEQSTVGEEDGSDGH